MMFGRNDKSLLNLSVIILKNKLIFIYLRIIPLIFKFHQKNLWLKVDLSQALALNHKNTTHSDVLLKSIIIYL